MFFGSILEKDLTMYVNCGKNKWVDKFYMDLYKRGYEPNNGQFGGPIYLSDGVEIHPDFKTSKEAKMLNQEEAKELSV
jgi:hypothetical protein